VRSPKSPYRTTAELWNVSRGPAFSWNNHGKSRGQLPNRRPPTNFVCFQITGASADKSVREGTISRAFVGRSLALRPRIAGPARRDHPRLRCRPCKGVLHKARVHTQELFCRKKYRLRLRGFFTVYTVVDETGIHSPLSSVDRKPGAPCLAAVARHGREEDGPLKNLCPGLAKPARPATRLLSPAAMPFYAVFSLTWMARRYRSAKSGTPLCSRRNTSAAGRVALLRRRRRAGFCGFARNRRG
jgi:hypothetical protein